MMKFKAVAIAICSLVCAGATWMAVEREPQYVSASASAVDISEGATISAWSTSAELKLLTISFPKNALPNFDYDAMDTETYAYILDYLCFNGKSVKTINEEMKAEALTWEYTQFPGNADNKYKVPVLVYERDAARLRLFIHENYFATLGANPTFEIKEGLTFVNDAGENYVMDETRKFVYDGSAWNAAKPETDITANVSISGWNTTGSASELTYSILNFGDGVLPSDLGYHVHDNDIGTHYHYIQDYITLNGKTVGEINANTDVSNYVFSSFPSTAASKYKLPIILFGNGNNLEMKIHNDYIASLGGNAPIVIGVKAGLSIDNGSMIHTVSSDITKTVREGVVETDITENVTITGWDTTGTASELTYTRIKLGEGVMPEGVGYGIIDNAAYKYMQDYITINGRTVADINANTDTSGYTFSTFPSSADNKYKVPVMIFVNGGTLEVKVHNDYIATLGDNYEMVIGVKAGLSVSAENVIYKVENDVSVTVKEKVNIVDVTANVTIGGWKLTGDMSELTYTTISFGAGVMPEGVDYGIMDTAKYGYLQEYITINGRTVKEINDTTDVSNYVFHSFPSTASEKYQRPIVIFVEGDNIRIKIHNDYLVSIGGNIDVFVGVKAGASITNGSTVYTVTEDVTKCVKGKLYTFTAEMYPGYDEQYLSGGAEIVVNAPEREHYIFEGWFEKGTDKPASTTMPSRDYAIYAKYTAIEYTVTFMANGEKVGEVTYTVEDNAINEPAVPEKVGYGGTWETYALDGGNKTVNAIYTVGTYYVTFKADGNTVATEEYTVENKNITVPSVPAKDFYTGAWETYELTTGNVTVNAVYTANTYTVTFKADGNMVDTEEYTVENKNITVPSVPAKDFYTGVWADYALNGGDVTVNAVYTANTYTVTFMADGVQVGETLSYTVGNTAIVEPSVPEKVGYGGTWETYALDGGNKVVNAIYTAGTYYVTFKVEGITLDTVAYTVESTEITEPAIPVKAHYTGVWESYELTTGDITVNAVYTAIEYTVTFMDGTTVVATAVYTIENKNIEVPAVPTKDGYTSEWATYALTGVDITVEVVYTLIEVEDETSSDSASEDITSEDSGKDSATDSTVQSTTSSDDEVITIDGVAKELGCKATVGGLSVGMLGLLAVALLKKKKED